jgi:hypothetical protein
MEQEIGAAERGKTRLDLDIRINRSAITIMRRKKSKDVKGAWLATSSDESERAPCLIWR